MYNYEVHIMLIPASGIGTCCVEKNKKSNSTFLNVFLNVYTHF